LRVVTLVTGNGACARCDIIDTHAVNAVAQQDFRIGYRQGSSAREKKHGKEYENPQG
jgi:hypothetical protein